MPLTPTLAASLVVPLILAGELRGALFEGSCSAAGADSRIGDLHRLAGPGVAPIVLSTGDILGPEPLSGYALEGPPEVQRELLRLLQRDDREPAFDVALPGNFELGTAPDRLRRLSDTPGGIPWTVANVGLSVAHRRHRVIVRGGIAIGLTGVVDDELAPSIDPAYRPVIAPPAAALDEAMKALRSAGVETIVAMVHVRRSAGIRRVTAILEALKEPPPDLVLTSALQGEPEYVRLDGARTIVAAAPSRSSKAVRIELVHDPDGRLAEIRAQTRPAPVMPSGSGDAVRNWVCSELDVPIYAEDAAVEIDRSAFIAFTLDQMRRAAHAEIALLPLGTFGPARAFPLSPRPTRLDVRRALPFEDGLAVAEVSGSELATLQALRLDPSVANAGITETEIAGRAIDPLRTYRVVTVEFLADGGDNLLDPGLLEFAPVEGGASLRRSVTEALRRRGFTAAGRPPEPSLLDLRANFGASLKSVNVENPSGAEAPQLTRANFLGVSGSLQLRLVLDLSRHRFELAESTRFGVVQEALEPGGESETRENEDVTTVELLYTGRLNGGLERPWVPDAGATARFETELTVPEERGYRRALLQAGVGPSWKLVGNLSLRSQLGFRRELLARSNSADAAEAALAQTRVAVLSTVELRDEILTEIGPAPSVLNLRLDHTIDLTGRVQDHVLQGRIGIDVPIIPGVALTAAVDVYVLERQREVGRSSSGAALDTSFGIKSTTDLSHVFFDP